MKQLRTALWQYAALHQGRFPGRDETTIDPGVWDIPGYPGLRFMNVPNLSADEAGRLLVFEPEIEQDSRQVLMTNGQITTMGTADIQHKLNAAREP